MNKKKNEIESVVVQMPEQLANMQLPAPELINFYSDLENRTFWIDDEVDINLMELVKYIVHWNREDKDVPKPDRKPIKILFFSPGGDLNSYRAVADVIKLSVTPVIGIVIGTAYSAAGMIYLACHKRYMLKSSSILFHYGSASLSGNFNEVYAAMMDYQDQVKELADIICESSNYTAEEIEERMSTDWYVRPQEAIEHGICDEIIEDISKLL